MLISVLPPRPGGLVIPHPPPPPELLLELVVWQGSMHTRAFGLLLVFPLVSLVWMVKVYVPLWRPYISYV